MDTLSDTPILDEGNDYNEDGDLFDYEAGLDEALRSLTNLPHNGQSVSNNASADQSAVALGLEKEVKVQKKRAPIAKLDEARLLSENGIPRLRRKAKSKLRFRGKGHEFSDAAQLLHFYQLWLDDLYPRAKFADGLSIIQKLGHSKRMQVMRRTWISEGRSDMNRYDTDGTVPIPTNKEADNPINGPYEDSANRRSGDDDISNSRTSKVDQNQDQPSSDDENDLFFSLPRSQHHQNTDVPDEDELDALLAECQEADRQKSPSAAGEITKKKDPAIFFSQDMIEDLEDDD